MITLYLRLEMLVRTIACIVLVFSATIAWAQTWVETNRITTPFDLDLGTTGVSFSNGTAISGNHYRELAVIYEQDASGNWGSLKITEVNPPMNSGDDGFGYSAAIHGNIAVIGS